MDILKSEIDRSINFVEQQLTGFLESRYVRKTEDYFICYLSSQTGCNRGCRFCHLTTTKQTKSKDSDYQDFLNQALQVFRHYRRDSEAQYMHYNFMARGEPLANEHIVYSADEILIVLGKLAMSDGLNPKFNISTIIPDTLEKELTDIFRIVTPTIYYSMYSVNPDFRKKWMPSAMNIEDSLYLLKEYQKLTKKIVKIHFPFIKGENDSTEDVFAIIDAINRHGIFVEFNIIRYNPYSEEQGEESSEEIIERNCNILDANFENRVKVIPRVGYDVKASCGMFVDKKV